jgi:hypothetical protein
MKIKLLVLLGLFGFSSSLLGQNSNFIIQVNEELVIDGILKPTLTFNSETEKFSSTALKYVPGNLILSDDLWSKILSDTTSGFVLSFNYQTFEKKKTDIAQFEIKLTKEDFLREYIVLNIYDFRDKKYKKWYQLYTDKNYLVNKMFPGSGIYPRYVD